MAEYKGKLTVEEEVGAVIRHIRDLIITGQVIPGGRLPAERKIALDTGISRGKVRLALERLEYYGVVTILPQSGSVISPLSITALERKLSSLIERNNFDFNSLVHVRSILETESVRLCALNHNLDDVVMMEQALQDFADNVYGPARDEKDFAFHSTIARCCHNPVVYHLLLMITPEVLHYYRRLKACAVSPEVVLEEHKQILNCIKDSDPDGAERALIKHFADITAFAASSKKDIPRISLQM